jgi:hypothetical protein
MMVKRIISCHEKFHKLSLEGRMNLKKIDRFTIPESEILNLESCPGIFGFELTDFVVEIDR